MDSGSTRPYRLRRRAETMEETRRRIAQATFELHTLVGPARTTIAAIAERADVQRATIYRHFPEEISLYRACVAHGIEVHPFPDIASWSEIEDPEERLRAGLTSLYGFYDQTAHVWENVLRDMPSNPLFRQAIAEAGVFDYFDRFRTALSSAWRGASPRRGRLVRAAIAHATEFPTYDSLVRGQGLTGREAVEVVTAMVRCAAHRTRRSEATFRYS